MCHKEPNIVSGHGGRPPVWFIAIAAVVLLIVVAVEQTGKQATSPVAHS